MLHVCVWAVPDALSVDVWYQEFPLDSIMMKEFKFEWMHQIKHAFKKVEIQLKNMNHLWKLNFIIINSILR